MGIWCVAQETRTGSLCQPRGVQWGGRWEEGLGGRGYIYTYGCFMLRFDQKHTKFCKAVILQLKNKFKKITKFFGKAVNSV